MSCFKCNDGKKPTPDSAKYLFKDQSKVVSGQYFKCNDGTNGRFCYSEPKYSVDLACKGDLDQTDFPGNGVGYYGLSERCE